MWQTKGNGRRGTDETIGQRCYTVDSGVGKMFDIDYSTVLKCLSDRNITLNTCITPLLWAASSWRNCQQHMLQ